MSSSPPVRAIATEIITLAATFAVIASVNYATTTEPDATSTATDPSPGTETSATSTGTDPSPTLATPRDRMAALVEAATEDAQQREVIAVACPTEARPGLATCAVTFSGPSCQLWLLMNRDDGEIARPISELLQDRHALHDEASGASRCTESD